MAIWKLVLLIAVLLMPFGMQSASAAPAQHHAVMPMQHCPDQAPNHGLKGAFTECTMACSAALPAINVALDEPLSIDRVNDRPTVAQVLHGLQPETATPPPKAS